MRLIDADRLKSYIDCGHLRPPTEVCFSELDVCNMIDKAPTVSAVQGWISCSERLPNYREAVLVSTFWGVRMAERYSVREDGTDDFWYLFLDDATARPMYVYAWMPLPKPYKGGDSE